MEITCLQMDVLINFYIENQLTETLKNKVEEHLLGCSTCRAKYNILSSLYEDMRESLVDDYDEYATNIYPAKEYKNFKTKLSAYVDNELPPEENIKIKKFTVSNKKARKELEDTYHIRKLMNDSFKKTKLESKPDFTKNVMKQFNSQSEDNLSFNPLIKVALAFVITVLVLSALIIVLLSF